MRPTPIEVDGRYDVRVDEDENAERRRGYGDAMTDAQRDLSAQLVILHESGELSAQLVWEIFCGTFGVVAADRYVKKYEPDIDGIVLQFNNTTESKGKQPGPEI